MTHKLNFCVVVKRTALFVEFSHVLILKVKGNFQSKFKVYNKEGKKISKFNIVRIKQCGRSTFFCPNLQKSQYNPKISNYN